MQKSGVRTFIGIGVLLLFSLMHTCERFDPAGEIYIYTDTITVQSSGTYLFSGGLLNVGRKEITQHGFCWSVNKGPSLDQGQFNLRGEISEAVEFSTVVTGLIGNTIYYVRAYATTEAGTQYSNEKWFTTSPPDMPAMTTAAVSNITSDSAWSGGTITYNGGSPVTARGVCWDTTELPTIDANHTSDGMGIGAFTSALTDLSCETLYHVRAYARNSAGIAYGNQVSFTTGSCAPGLATVMTVDIFDITQNSAKSGGHVTDGSITGEYTSWITGLDPNTTYFVRAYATNKDGTAYGEERSFRTWSGTVTDFDGNIYPTVVIGDQTWMQKNLNVTHYADGTPIPLVENEGAWGGLSITDKACCWYDNSSSSGDTYGALYNWAAAMNGAGGSDSNPSGVQGVCPSGWHLPSDEEWKQLEMHLGMSRAVADNAGYRGTDEGGKLKETGETLWAGPNTGATNESGFTALPGGRRQFGGAFGYISSAAYWWNSSEGDAVNSYSRFVYYNGADVYRGYLGRGNGFSVRCVKDELPYSQQFCYKFERLKLLACDHKVAGIFSTHFPVTRISGVQCS